MKNVAAILLLLATSAQYVVSLPTQETQVIQVVAAPEAEGEAAAAGK
jgi:hypothetical protein